MCTGYNQVARNPVVRVEFTEKFLMVLWLAPTYLEYCQATEQAHENPADVIRSYRQEHAVFLLKNASVWQCPGGAGSIYPVLCFPNGYPETQV
jgi:hypothetical protein